MEEKNYSGYFCENCKSIPIIKIIHKNQDVKVFSSCKCYKQYESIDSFYKNKYKKNIDINMIKNDIPNNLNNFNFEKSNIDSIIKKFNIQKSKIIEEGIKIKNELIDIFKRKIEEVNQIYLKYNERNNKIILILEEIVKSYELLKDNKLNKLNVINNCHLKENKKYNFVNKYKNLETLSNDIKNYFRNDYIVSNLDTNTCLESEYLYYSPNKVKNLLVLENDIIAFCTEYYSKEIVAIKLNQRENEIFKFIAHTENVEYLIKSNTNNIISYGEDNLIKIWPSLNREILSEMDENSKYLKNKCNFNYKHKEISKDLNFILFLEKGDVIKLLTLKENRFLMILKTNKFLLFKYSINEITLDKTFENKDNDIEYIFDAFFILNENEEIIALNNNASVYFYELNNFKLINRTEVKYMSKNGITQINSNQILIGDGYSIKLLDLKTFQIKLTIKNEERKMFILNLNDGTFVQGVGLEVKRFFIKTMEELPILIQNPRDDNYDDELDFNNYDDLITHVYKLNDGRIITCFNNGRVEIGFLKFG